MSYQSRTPSITPKSNIVDSSFMYSKTFTVEPSPVSARYSAGEPSNGCSLGKPGSSALQADVIAEKCSNPSNFNLNTNSPANMSSNNKYLHAPKMQPKKSLIHNIFRRLSHTKVKRSDVKTEPVNFVANDTIKAEIQLENGCHEEQNSNKLRRWLSKRVLRSKSGGLFHQDTVPRHTHMFITENDQMQNSDSPVLQVDVDQMKESCSLEILGQHKCEINSNNCGSATPDSLNTGLSDGRSNYIPSYLNISVAAFGYSHRPYGDDRSVAASRLVAANKNTNLLSPSELTFQDTSPPQLHSVDTVQAPVSNAFQSPQLSSTILQSNSNDLQQVLPQTPVADRSLDLHQLVSTNIVTLQVDSYATSSKAVSSDMDSVKSPPATSQTAVKMRRTRTRSQTGGGPDDRDHWQRSSLIMLAVSHASPRVRPATVLVPSALVHLEASSGSQLQSEADKPLGNRQHQIEYHPAHSSTKIDVLPAVDDEFGGSHANEQCGCGGATTTTVTNENGQSAVAVAMVVPPPHGRTGNGEVSGGYSVLNCAVDTSQQEGQSVVDGNFFLRLVDQVETELWSKIKATEGDLEAVVGLNDEVCGLMRTAAGKARLLVTEKFTQFRGLCHQNLQWTVKSKVAVHSDSSSSNGTSDNELVTLVSDLDGFWAMVSLQVTDVQQLFDQVNRLRESNWRLPLDSNDLMAGQSSNHSVGSSSSHSSRGCNSMENPRRTQVKREGKSKQSTPAVFQQARDDVQRAKAHERLQLFKQSLQAKSSHGPPDVTKPEDFISFFF